MVWHTKLVWKLVEKQLQFFGSGFYHIYPPEHLSLSKFILEHGGLLLSEYPPNVTANTKNFPMRNRIISGLSDSTLVIESAFRSGSSITANYALKHNKKVFCIPYSLDSSYSGTNRLIQKGAYLVTSPQDILTIPINCPLPLSTKANFCNLPSELKESLPVYQHITNIPVSITTLLEKTNLSFEKLSSILTLLEIHGYIKSLPGNQYCKEDSYE